MNKFGLSKNINDNGLGAYLYMPSKYVILTCTYFQDPIAKSYGFNKKIAYYC